MTKKRCKCKCLKSSTRRDRVSDEKRRKEDEYIRKKLEEMMKLAESEN